MIVIIMGVTGCGKTTIGVLLARQLGWPFYDADDFHSDANKAKMHAGIPLTDQDRIPWLQSLRSLLIESEHNETSMVLACSALKARFRSDLTAGIDDATFVYLKGSKEIIAERLAARKGHYMNPNLLDSQFEALEEPKDALVADCNMPPEKIVSSIRSRLGL